MTELISLIVPFAGTTLGAMMVFFMKDGIKESVEKGLLGFAAGAMFYVIVEELIPESQMGEHSNIGTIGAAIGFMLMMVLDVALG